MGANPPLMGPQFPIIFFDGVCNLCSGAAKLVIRYDRHQYFKFASLQSSFARTFFSQQGINCSFDSIVLFQENQFYSKSDAALAIVRKLDFPFPLLYVFKIFPRGLRDFVYDYIAGRRYRWFGKMEQCMIPSPEISKRFVP